MARRRPGRSEGGQKAQVSVGRERGDEAQDGVRVEGLDPLTELRLRQALGDRVHDEEVRLGVEASGQRQEVDGLPVVANLGARRAVVVTQDGRLCGRIQQRHAGA